MTDYEDHRQTALAHLEDSCLVMNDLLIDRNLTRAQIHATLALAAATVPASVVPVGWLLDTAIVGEQPEASPAATLSDTDAAGALVALSQWIDAGNAGRDPEAITWGRLAKASEEVGEMTAAYIGATGQNPRKGITHSTDAVVEEALDVAVTVLGLVEHLTGHEGDALALLEDKIIRVARRAGLLR